MKRNRNPSLFLAPLAALVLALALPSAASAVVYTFNDTRANIPVEELKGPGKIYPQTISVGGIEGTVSKVTVSFFDLSVGNELDMALVGPNGQAVMLVSDACSTERSSFFGNGIAYWTFDDAAPIPVPAGKCGLSSLDSRSLVQPTNISGSDSDQFPLPGPQGSLPNRLSLLAGGSPNGDWKLYMNDDEPIQAVGFTSEGWSLHLEVTPPPAPAPQIITVQVPVPAPAPSKTGKRAAALAKCKSKPTAEKKAACRAKAKKLPL